MSKKPIREQVKIFQTSEIDYSRGKDVSVTRLLYVSDFSCSCPFPSLPPSSLPVGLQSSTQKTTQSFVSFPATRRPPIQTMVHPLLTVSRK